MRTIFVGYRRLYPDDSDSSLTGVVRDAKSACGDVYECVASWRARRKCKRAKTAVLVPQNMRNGILYPKKCKAIPLENAHHKNKSRCMSTLKNFSLVTRFGVQSWIYVYAFVSFTKATRTIEHRAGVFGML